MNGDILNNDFDDSELLNNGDNFEDLTSNVVNSELNKDSVETLDDNFNGFTPVVSDGIVEEVLDINEQNEVLENNLDNDIFDTISNDEVLNKDFYDEKNFVDVIASDDVLENEKVLSEVNENPQEVSNNVITENSYSTNKVDSLIDDNIMNNEQENISDEEVIDFKNLECKDNADSSDFNSDNQEIENNVDNLSEFIDLNNDVLVNEKENSNLVDSHNEKDVYLNDINDVNNLNSNTEAVLQEDSMLEKYGDNFSIKEYVCNPAIGRDNEIKQLILTLLTPEKSGILVGKPGIGKTAIVEGLGYQIQKGNVPAALKDYQIYKLNTSSLLGLMPGTNEPKIQVLLNEIKGKRKLILFIDEIHTLIGTGAEGDSSLDFANIFKPGLDRGNIKIIGATTSDEYDRYILTDKAFVRRFQKIEVLEPTKEQTVKILMGSLPKLEYKTGAKMKYTPFIQEKIMTFIVDLTTEYRRVYELSARYPDVSLTILQQAFSYAVFDNKQTVGIRDVRKAISNTKLVYPDVIKKELIRFNDVFSDIYLMETPQRLKGETSN